MRLSNRLWRAIAHRFAERETTTEILVWAKVTIEAVGKRHAFITISLTPDEERSVLRLMRECRDLYWTYVLAHERKHNPDCPAAPISDAVSDVSIRPGGDG